MSDPLRHDEFSDDLFRNRIAAALHELDQPESDADIAATLDMVDAEPLTEVATRRIMQEVQRSIAATSASRRSLTLRVEKLGSESQLTGRRRSQMGIVAVCASALVAAGLVFVRLDDVQRSPLRTGELMSSNDRHPGFRSIQTEQFTNIAMIQRVKLGETLSTGPREKRRVTLLDGSMLSINERSQVTIAAERRVKLLAGEVFVEVVPTKSSERFVVETPHRTVTALGTKFVVKTQGRGTNVVVTQGKVQVSGVDEVIPAGQELIADLTESNSAELRPAKRSAYVVEWVKDLMAAAGSIVVPASEHGGGTITVVDPNGQEMKLSLRKFHVDVHIEDGFARTTIDQTYFNHTWQQLEGTFRFPLPADASLSRLAMYVNGKLMEGGMVERDYGRNVFEQIRHTRRDPALLEWVDGSTFQMRVFPLEARQEKRILLSYTQRLPSDYGKSVYRFPAGHSLEGVREWSAHLRVKGAAGMKWYSPSHLLNGRDEQGDLLIDGRDEYAALDRDLIVELSEEKSSAGERGGVSPPVSSRQDRGANTPRSPEAAWSVCEQDGFQYVMLRQRPELRAIAERSQRQWIFLIENSADRNEVLAETQRQIAKVLLENSEHSDTFSIIRAGTQAESFRRKPVECSLENVAAGQQFLRDVAPIGALDLEQALQAVQKQVRGKRDIFVVHLGTGIPVLGERDDNTLLRLLPANARYVGVAVGKRWSKSFMETAASHSGGHVTQINPDEAVAWRAFDLLSTLNAPRLTEIAVRSVTRSVREGERSTDLASGSEFLLLTNSLAHGQELAAVARFPKGQALPKSVTITGKLNGKAYSQAVDIPTNAISRGALAPGSDVQSVREPDASAFRLISNVGHLPRTWARLEIDRLVALGATEHKPQIIELSKSMYVMSPFTSLLVLETEAMYEQFKVDRGRKDHWAMYPAPAEIPVVADQGPSQLSPLDAAKERLQLAQAQANSAQSNYERSVTEKRPGADLQRLDRLSRAEQAEVRLIEREIQRIERANDAAANPVRKAWESVVQRRSAWQQVYFQTVRNHWDYWGRPTYWNDSGWSNRGDLPVDLFPFPGVWDGDNGNGVIDPGILMPSSNRMWEATDDVLQFALMDRLLSREKTVNLFARPTLQGLNGNLPVTSYYSTLIDSENFVEERYRRVPRLAADDDFLFGDWAKRPRGLVPNFSRTDFETRRSRYVNLNAISRPEVLAAILDDRDDVFRLRQPQDWGLWSGEFGIQNDFSAPEVWFGASDARSKLGGLSRGGRPFIGRFTLGETREFDVDMNGDGIRDMTWFDMDSGLVATNGRAIRPWRQAGGGGGFGGVTNGGFMMPGDWIETDGRYPVVAAHPLTDVLKDLPSYAPGLQTWPADRLAIVEQAAATKPKSGEVDAEARRLIEKARSLGWESCRMAALGRPAVLKSQISNLKSQTGTVGGGHPTVVVLADGSGRFVFDREVGEGLKEQVIHDGTTLWHLYPEIGLAAKRSISRFHQSAIQSLLPWYVPSAEDLSVDADVKAIGERTIRISRRMSTPASPETEVAQKTKNEKRKDGQECPSSELTFAEDGRLGELRLVDSTSNILLARQTFAADGTVRLFDADEKLVAEVRYERQPVEAPNLVPSTKDLVVLPLPYRSVAGVPVSVPVNLQTNAPDFAKLSDDDARMLLATYFAEARQAELVTFIEQRYTAKGDHRIGLAVLLASVIPQNPLVATATKQHPDLPLAKFLEQFAGFPAQGNLNGTLDAGDAASPFLKRVCSAYNHYVRWATDRAAARERPATDIERDLNATLLFIRDCRSVDLAAKLLSTVELGLKRTARMNATFARQLNEATAAMADERGIPAFGRSARIEWLLLVGDEASATQAKDLFRTQLADSIGGSQSRQRLGFVGPAAQSLATLATTFIDAPILNGETRGAFVKHFKTPDGQPCGPWGDLVKEAAHNMQISRNTLASGSGEFVKPDASAFQLIALARSCVSLSEPALAATIFQLAIKDQDLSAQPRLNLAALDYAKQAGDWEQAEACVRRALADERFQKVSTFWRDAADIAHRLNKFNEWIEFLDRAYELEFAALPKTVNLDVFRKDYESLFGQLDERAQQLADAKHSETFAFARLVQRAAARWRDIDVDDTAACHRTATILTKLGLSTAAWNYWTTPLAETPDRATAWQTFAAAMHSQHRLLVADRAWSTAFACEPTNPEILLQHAQFLRSTRQEHQARELLTKITTSTWQPRFENTKQQAQALLTGGSSP